MIAIWKEKGQWCKESYTAQRFEDSESLRNAAKAYRGVLSCLATYGDYVTEEKALKMYFDEIRPR